LWNLTKPYQALSSLIIPYQANLFADLAISQVPTSATLKNIALTEDAEIAQKITATESLEVARAIFQNQTTLKITEALES
jgi:phosphotransacetylase